ncbi:LytR/AlgR family response regulator transcription factor [Muriicola sp. Z0-33]|uniref:LytR/AlgR family response regulator transcription factor n=1 Tax=Muriicola sp. Z0-33 TaxID=2816957 RepID=UPI00223756BE|nr:LytTR family DNA-binding domain-containing protein [Muriicola sp. Z0-33]MCW5515749.1 response regulator transcription factor [Muriicola sp. Z0-33]
MIRCIIIEDQPPAQRVLKKYIEDMGNMELNGTFADALEAMNYLKKNNIDLIFLDIHLPKISGIDFLKTLTPKPHVILTTAFSDYALESYEYNVIDYLLKPFSFERFVQAVSRIPDKGSNFVGTPGKVENSSDPEIFFIKSGYEHIKININDIRFIQSNSDYTELFLTDSKHLSQEPLRFWVEYLNPKKFVRIHKSYIINTEKIVKIVGNQVYLANKFTLPIGRAFKEDFMNNVIK